MKKLLVLSLVLVFVLSLSLFAYGESYLLAPKSLNNPYWFAVENGMKDAAKKLGVKAIFDAPVEADVAKQAQKIIDYVIKGVAGIGISPNDPEGIKVAAKKALEKGIPVITFDADAPNSGRYVYVGTNNYKGGYEAGKLMAKFIKEKKADKSEIRLAILTGGLAALNLNQRIQGFKDALSKNCSKKIVYVADPFPCNDDTAKSIQIIGDVMRKYKDLDGWFMAGGWPLFAPPKSLEQALGGKERIKNLIVISFDTLPPELEIVKAGIVQGLVGQRPYMMGYLSMMILFDMARLGVEQTLRILPEDRKVDTGLDVVTQENVVEFMKSVEKIYQKRR